MHWLIDGHNLIGQMPNLHLNDPDDEEKLLLHLRRYRARTGHPITVVFDCGWGYRPGTKTKQGGITVQFAPSGKTADQLLMRRIRRIKNPQAYMVVTSDRAVQNVATQYGVRVLSSSAFSNELLSAPLASDEPEGSDVNLSADEVDEWLDLFNRSE